MIVFLFFKRKKKRRKKSSILSVADCHRDSKFLCIFFFLEPLIYGAFFKHVGTSDLLVYFLFQIRLDLITIHNTHIQGQMLLQTNDWFKFATFIKSVLMALYLKVYHTFIVFHFSSTWKLDRAINIITAKWPHGCVEYAE